MGDLMEEARKSGFSSWEDYARVEYEILGVPLSKLSEETLSDLGITHLNTFRRYNVAGIQDYNEKVTRLFKRTRESFDWAKSADRWVEFLSEKNTSDQEVQTSGYMQALPSDFEQVCKVATSLMRRKGISYGDSWKKRGQVGVFMNIARKFDRIENILEASAKGFDVDPDKIAVSEESLLDTVLDLFVYSGLYMTLLKEKHPELWEELVKESGSEPVLYQNGVDLQGKQNDLTVTNEL